MYMSKLKIKTSSVNAWRSLCWWPDLSDRYPGDVTSVPTLAVFSGNASKRTFPVNFLSNCFSFRQFYARCNSDL